jgi:hypothetical protein
MSSPLDTTPASVLRLVQERRLALINGKAEEIDKNQVQVLRDLAKTSIDELRVNVEAEGLELEREMAQAFTRIAAKVTTNPYLQGEVVDRPDVTLTHDDIPPVTLVEGETATDPSDLDFKTFTDTTRM